MHYTDLALSFANSLVDGRYDDAHRLLAKSTAGEFTAARLRVSYRSMIAYGGNPASGVRLVNQDDDLGGDDSPNGGWAYVAISGPSKRGGVWSEAVAVVVTEEEDKLVISEIEWGRP